MRGHDDDGMAGLSALLRLAALGAMIGLPIAWAVGAIHAGPGGAALAETLAPLPAQTEVSRAELAVSLALSLVPLALTLAVLGEVVRLLGLYASGDVLGPAPAARIGRIGWWLLILAPATVLAPALQTLVVTWDNPPGAHILRIAIGSGTYMTALAGGVMLTVGAAMRRAAAARAELEGFV